MVAVIHFSKGFNRVLNYNEQKVSEQVAVCLDAVNYPKNVADLSLNQKLKRLQNQAALNERTTVNSVHISLNFDPSEQLSDNKLNEIAGVYMEKIGFGEQPYLLYRHDDAGHPHVHIVTTNIKADGKRIELHNLGKNQSEKARKEIEITYGLLKAEDAKQREKYELNPVSAAKVRYGKSATKRAITTVLNKVLKEYKYTSLPELNAVLKQYNICADRGSTNSRIYQHNGLTYRILDEKGNKVGVPIKASDFYNKPTLKYLEERYKINEPLRQPHLKRIKYLIDLSLAMYEKPTLDKIVQALSKEGINVIIRQNENGVIYGLTYVDHQTKCVFNGSDLGKQYSAKAIQERCAANASENSNNNFKITDKINKNDQPSNVPGATSKSLDASISDALLQQEFTGDLLPFDLKRKKKKRKRLSSNQ